MIGFSNQLAFLTTLTAYQATVFTIMTSAKARCPIA